MLVDSGSSLVSIFCPVDKVVVFFTKVLMTEASMNQRSLTRYATPSSGDTPKAELADNVVGGPPGLVNAVNAPEPSDRKSTRLNSSHQIISYAVFCLKKKKNYHTTKNH